jgi:hypothetical protein
LCIWGNLTKWNFSFARGEWFENQNAHSSSIKLLFKPKTIRRKLKVLYHVMRLNLIDVEKREKNWKKKKKLSKTK